jgi:hypothetical protein
MPITQHSLIAVVHNRAGGTLMRCTTSFLAIAACLMFGVFSRGGSKADAPTKVSAKQLTADFLKDKAAASKKYGDAMSPKEVIVDGDVVSLEDGKYGKIAKLEGEGKAVVSVLLRKEDEGDVKKGDHVTFKGRCRGLFEKDKSVDLNGGVLQKDK